MIRIFEEMSMNAWPALESMLYDGWVLRLSHGYTRRANSINPIYSSNETVEEKIKRCEKIYGSKKLKTIYKITPDVYPHDLDKMLENHSYIYEAPTSVQLLDLTDIPAPILKDCVIETQLTQEWFEEYCVSNNVSQDNQPILKNILQSIIPSHCFITLKKDGKNIGFGLGVIENGYMGLFDILVKKEYRNCGFGKQLLLNLFQYGIQNGVTKTYLQVMLDNPPALSLYSKLGFKEIYKYWYRVK